MDLKQRKTTSQ